jgi:hypothetical protein
MRAPRSKAMAAFSVIVPALLAAACSPAATSPEVGGTTTATSPEVGGTTTAPATTTTAPATTTAGSPGSSLVGTWASPSCGERTYVRQIDFADGGTFSAADLVSPCPPKVVCVWSGIVNRKGTYAVAAGKIALTVDGSAGPQGKPLPASLGLDPATGAPFETDSSGKTCLYERQAMKP